MGLAFDLLEFLAVTRSAELTAPRGTRWTGQSTQAISATSVEAPHATDGTLGPARGDG
jgi:hypothetical protein